MRSLREEMEDDIREEERRSDIDASRCPNCGSLLIHTYEPDDAYGTRVNIPVTYCPYCG